tara:strand:+ start:228 stop:623 length:396 start_codon:yes stop_codon:yes gene_type:complete
MIKYGIIKLVTGEELFAQIEEFVEDDNSLILMDPCIIREVPNNRKGPFALYKIDAWLNLSDEHIFCLKMDHIVYWSRTSDKEKISTYKRWLKTINKKNENNTGRVGISTSLGLICTVTQTRESLENLFKNS